MKTKSKSKMSTEILEIFSKLKDKNVKLSMLKESELVDKLISNFHIKPVVIEKKAKMSLPHIYHMKTLAAMTPKMKALIVSGKIKGTDALSILSKTKDEKKFIEIANKVAEKKVDHRLSVDVTPSIKVVKRGPGRPSKVKAVSTEPKRSPGRPKKVKPVSTEPKRSPGRPRKVKEETVRQSKLKDLILTFLGRKLNKVQSKSLDSFVEILETRLDHK